MEFSQEAGSRSMATSNDTIPGHVPEGLCWRDACSFMLTGAPFIISRNWQQRRYLSADEWMMTTGTLHNGILNCEEK